MSTKFLYALTLTLCGVALNLLMYFTGFQTEKLATGQYFQWIGIVIMGVVLWLGIKAVREESEGRYLTYGKGVGSGVLISLYSGLMTAVYTYIHFKFVNPEFVDYQLVLIREKWVAAGLGDAQMEQAEKITRMMMGPGGAGLPRADLHRHPRADLLAHHLRHPETQPATRASAGLKKTGPGLTRPRRTHCQHTTARRLAASKGIRTAASAGWRDDRSRA